jgi:hypothetical protein
LKVKVVIYRTRQIVGLFGIGLTRTTREIVEGDLTEDAIDALKRSLKGGRKQNG